MPKRERYVYLDLLKCIAILFVCLYHFSWANRYSFKEIMPVKVLVHYFFWGINSVCVPVFMMVNGALLLNGKFDLRRHVLKWFSMLCGMFIWYYATLFLALAYKHGIGYVIKNVGAIMGSIEQLTEIGGVGMTHIWFVLMLLAVYIVVPVMKHAFDSGTRDAMGSLLFMGGMLYVLCIFTQDIEHVRAYIPYLKDVDMYLTTKINPTRNDVYGAMLFYFILGGILHRYYQRISSTQLWMGAAVFVLGAVMHFTEWYLMTRQLENFYDIVYFGYNCTSNILMSTGLFVAAAALCRRMNVEGCRLKHLISLIGRNTLTVYYMHWILGYTVLKMIPHGRGFGVNFVKAVGLVLVCAVAGEAATRMKAGICCRCRRLDKNSH